MSSVFLDISKAFDRVWHQGVKIYKLKQAGIEGPPLEWLSHYLKDRKRVVLPDVSSEWSFLKAGVLEGSILGPLLFLVIINDIVVDLNINISRPNLRKTLLTLKVTPLK